MKIKTHRIYFNLLLTDEQKNTLDKIKKDEKYSIFFTSILIDFIDNKLNFCIDSNLDLNNPSSNKLSSTVLLTTDYYLRYLDLIKININGLEMFLTDNQLCTSVIYAYINNTINTSKTKTKKGTVDAK